MKTDVRHQKNALFFVKLWQAVSASFEDNETNKLWAAITNL
jgi:hypothetical protein